MPRLKAHATLILRTSLSLPRRIAGRAALNRRTRGERRHVTRFFDLGSPSSPIQRPLRPYLVCRHVSTIVVVSNSEAYRCLVDDNGSCLQSAPVLSAVTTVNLQLALYDGWSAWGRDRAKGWGHDRVIIASVPFPSPVCNRLQGQTSRMSALQRSPVSSIPTRHPVTPCMLRPPLIAHAQMPRLRRPEVPEASCRTRVVTMYRAGGYRYQIPAGNEPQCERPVLEGGHP